MRETREEFMHDHLCDLSVIIPVHNDEQNLKRLYELLEVELQNITSNYEIVFVDNESKDGTFRYLSDLRDSNKRVKLIKLTNNYGLPKAITAGMDHSCGEVIVIMDAGMRYLPIDISALLEPIQAYDVPMTVGNLIPDKRVYHRAFFKLKRFMLILFGKNQTSLDNPGIFRAITRSAYNSVKSNPMLTGTAFCRIRKAKIDYLTIDIIRKIPGADMLRKLSLAMAESFANMRWDSSNNQKKPNYKIDKIIW